MSDCGPILATRDKLESRKIEALYDGVLRVSLSLHSAQSSSSRNSADDPTRGA